MPAAVAVPIREQIVAQHQAGQSLGSIAQALGLSVWTVRRIWRRYRVQGAVGLVPGYGHSGRRGPCSPRLSWRAAVWLKRLHPTWGAGLILTLLKCRWPEQAWPQPRTLQRWFVQAGLASPRRRRLPAAHVWSGAPHAVWQMDAKEGVRLADGAHACWLGLIDECSGALLEAVVFPPALLGDSRSERRAVGLARGLQPLGLAVRPTGG
jgi:hypothetical protein